jgi:hypothetical protein
MTGHLRLCGCVVALIVGGGAAGCSGTVAIDSGLTGVVLRGPIEPVCQVGASCDAPFAASFTVQQGGRAITTFRSDANGQFEVMLASGAYTVVPAPDAPVISPTSQGKPVVVGPQGLTTVRLEFDTGIR